MANQKTNGIESHIQAIEVNRTRRLIHKIVQRIGFLIIFWFRLNYLLSFLFHVSGHALFLFFSTLDRHYLRLEILTEGIPLGQLFMSVSPSQPSLPNLAKPDWQRDRLNTIQFRFAATGGIIMNAITGFTAFQIFLNGLISMETGLPVIFLTVLSISFCYCSLLSALSLPDLLAFSGLSNNDYACGPAFAIRYKTGAKTTGQSIISERLKSLVKILSREAATRGGQSAGFSIMTQKSDRASIIFDKVVKGKRQDIVQVISEKLSSLATKAEKEGYKTPLDFEVILLHLRYATGGATHWHNAQPHWYEHYPAMLFHSIKNGRLNSENREVFNMIAHNGDFDALYLNFKINGQKVRHLFPQPQARKVFQSIMPWTTSQGDSDSRSIAEWLDFVYTKGLTFKAIRFAYFTAALDYNQQICQNKFDLDQLYHWAEQLDLFLISCNTENNICSADAKDIKEISNQHKLQLCNLLSELSEKTIAESDHDDFIHTFSKAFFEHDLTWVMRQASLDFVGEFALMACSTLEQRLGVFSLTQAFSIGHNLTTHEVFGSAEPQGVTSALHAGETGDQAMQIYLKDGQYATVDFNASDQSKSILIYSRATLDDDLTFPPTPVATSLLIQNQADSDWFPVNENPKLERFDQASTPGKEIEKDLQDIPFNLKLIQNSFLENGENTTTLESLYSQISHKLKYHDNRDLTDDLILFGVDFNQDLAEEFADALQSIFPSLKVSALNSGLVLKEMKRAKREGISRFSKNTLFLAISNSAQTQSTLAAIRKAYELSGRQHCFVLTQSFLNSMSQAIGQGYQLNDPILPNTFVNLSHHFPDGRCGRRRSEAATIVPIATQAVLTEILIGLTQRAIQEFIMADKNEDQTVHGNPVRTDLLPIDIEAFRAFQTAVYEIEIPNRIGYNRHGDSIDSPDSLNIEHEAQARAENNIEYVKAYALFASYIIVATLFGIPVFNVLSAPLQTLTGVSFIANVFDALLFLFAFWFIHLGFRLYQGRPIYERIGSRTELFIERRYIARMLERYNATLFSNAPAFLTPFFYWADTIEDALHRFGIRAHRGVVTIHRIPDERMGIEEANNAAEENMVFSQIGGIRFNAGQPQSRDKVRAGSNYMNQSKVDELAHPHQLVLSDSLQSLRDTYQHRLSPLTFRLINRRLIDLSDGLLTEFVISLKRKNHVNQSIWHVIKWLPVAEWVRQLIMQQGIDIKNMIGNADTANQAQIQSTKHPVSPMDIETETLEPRPSQAIFSETRHKEIDKLAVFTLYEDHLSLLLNHESSLVFTDKQITEIALYPQQDGRLSSPAPAIKGWLFQAVIQRVAGDETLIIHNNKNDLSLNFKIQNLSQEQQQFLLEKLKISNYLDYLHAA